MVGERDPITPPPFSAEIAASVPAQHVRLETFANCGHGIVGDDAGGALQMIRAFIEEDWRFEPQRAGHRDLWTDRGDIANT